MGNVGTILSRISFEFVGDVVGVVLAVEEDGLLFDVCDLESGLLKNHDDFPLVYFVLLSEMDDLGGS